MKIMTIEERASNVVCNVFHKEFWNDKVDADMRQIKNLMVEFAIEQREMDKKEFITKLKNACLTVETKYNMNTFGFLYDRILEAMKGE